MKQPKMMAIAVATLISSSAIAYAEDVTINRLLASQCAQCHGTFGRAVGDIDELNGEGYKDLVEDLDDMRGEDFPEDIMEHQALGYTQDQIERIARYYASLPEGNGRNSEDKDED
jgi:cytochrome c553